LRKDSILHAVEHRDAEPALRIGPDRLADLEVGCRRSLEVHQDASRCRPAVAGHDTSQHNRSQRVGQNEIGQRGAFAAAQVDARPAPRFCHAGMEHDREERSPAVSIRMHAADEPAGRYSLELE
jgi:hypothetical protein